MYTSIFGQNRAGHGWRFLSISIVGIMASITSQAVIADDISPNAIELNTCSGIIKLDSA